MIQKSPASKIALLLSLLVMPLFPAFAEDRVEELRLAPASAPTAESAAIVVPDDGENGQHPVETHTLWGGFGGYRFLSVRNFGGRAAEYDYLHSGFTGGAHYNRLGPELKYSLEGSYLNDRDYHGDVQFDYAGDYRFHLRTESLFHGLDHERLFSPSFNSMDAFGNQAGYLPLDLDPAGRHGIRVEQDLAALRFKLHDYPLHLNLGYWRLLREGTSQLRFADHAFEGTTTPPAPPNPVYTNTIYSRSRLIDRRTHEGTVGLDSHLGPVDLVYTFQVRQFEDLQDAPRDSYIERVDVSNTLVRFAGLQQHNEDPDSRFMAHTVKLHTSLAGGITGAASYSYGRRENRSRLTDIRGADQAVTTLQNMAGDFTYTPCRQFSAAVKYRRQEVDADAPPALDSAFAAPAIVEVRPSLDSRKDTLTVTLSLRPVDLLTFKGEYRGEFLHRDSIDNGPPEMSWRLPENVALHLGSLTLISRPIKALRLKAKYGYTAADHPSYGSSFAERHEGQLFATYAGSSLWGATASYRAFRESNDRITQTTIDLPLIPLTFSNFPVPLSRDRSGDNATLSAWIAPLERITVTGSYGLLRTATDQQVLLSSLTPAIMNAANFTSQAHVYGLNMAYRLNGRLDLSLALQQVRSLAEFSPTATVLPSGANTSGITEISRLKTVESSLSARADYHINRHATCSVDYGYRDYDDKTASFLDGTVQTVMAYLSAKW